MSYSGMYDAPWKRERETEISHVFFFLCGHISFTSMEKNICPVMPWEGKSPKYYSLAIELNGWGFENSVASSCVISRLPLSEIRFLLIALTQELCQIFFFCIYSSTLCLHALLCSIWYIRVLYLYSFSPEKLKNEQGCQHWLTGHSCTFYSHFERIALIEKR